MPLSPIPRASCTAKPCRAGTAELPGPRADQNRYDLTVNVRTSTADGYAEPEVAATMLADVCRPDSRVMVGADKNYDTRGFIKACREMKVTPHVARHT